MLGGRKKFPLTTVTGTGTAEPPTAEAIDTLSRVSGESAEPVTMKLTLTSVPGDCARFPPRRALADLTSPSVLDESATTPKLQLGGEVQVTPPNRVAAELKSTEVTLRAALLKNSETS